VHAERTCVSRPRFTFPHPSRDGSESRTALKLKASKPKTAPNPDDKRWPDYPMGPPPQMLHNGAGRTILQSGKDIH
jgi:hypothetical protein